MYCGYITTLHGVRKHSNADRLQCVEVFGQNVIVDLSYKDGDRVVFFPSDGQLSEEFAKDNNLVRVKDENGNNIGGYMDPEKRNITAIRLRGEKSEGLVLPISVLAKYTNIEKLRDGEQITTLDGKEICRKYIPKRNHRDPNSKRSKSKKKLTNGNVKEEYLFFEEHKDTAQLAYNLNTFKPGDTIYITRKFHGSSQRSMYTTKETTSTNWFRKLFHLPYKVKREKSFITGSRRVVLTDLTKNDGYYSDNGFRKKWNDILDGVVPEGITVFYELVGYVNESTPIMASCNNSLVKDKAFKKKFGETTVFSYGCEPGECDMYVYRMTATTADGTVIEIPWEEVKRMCEKMGVKHVLELDKFLYTTQEDLLARVHKFTEGMPADEVGKTHIAEGVVVRIDNRSSFTAFKEKVFEFKILEGIIKDTSDAPDMEEAQEVPDDET